MHYSTLILMAGGYLLLQWMLAGRGSAKPANTPTPVMPADLATPDVDTPRQGFAALLVVRGALANAGVPSAEITKMIEPIAPYLLRQPKATEVQS